jgi:hypothetical protein
LQHEDIVGVKVHAQTSSTRRSDVRVGLYGMSQRQFEVSTEPGQWQPISLQRLQGDRRPEWNSSMIRPGSATSRRVRRAIPTPWVTRSASTVSAFFTSLNFGCRNMRPVINSSTAANENRSPNPFGSALGRCSGRRDQ